MDASTATASRLATATDVLVAYGHMAVIDSNDDFERRVVKLSQMNRRKKARNNCWVMSSQIAKNVTPAEFAAVELKTVTIYDTHSAAFHSALLVTDNNGEYVADFTAA